MHIITPAPLNETDRVGAVGDDAAGKNQSTLVNEPYPGTATDVKRMHVNGRKLTGPWMECNHTGCILPREHRGDHA